ncbi:MAG TPA: palindromic element RPE1 domain-containing protein [Rickettsia endosymbiont of Pyrocoelia pectoralis]|nr:palindromic element RPE1 domain-containing protein [Rickettsia endosymbiont of Pyrocoelia pectoralis]
MLAERLEFSLNHNKLHNSWIIEAENVEEALKDLQNFVHSKLFNDNIPLENHPDYRLIAKEVSSVVNTKNISIEQIRKLQEFLSKTSGISGFKVAVIYGADLMNLNAANSCLKILEDTPKNSYIFLITSRAASIISTIRSRCFKISIRSSQNYIRPLSKLAYGREFEGDTEPRSAAYIDVREDSSTGSTYKLPAEVEFRKRSIENESYSRFIQPIANNEYLNILNLFGSKDRELWLDFIDNILLLMNRILKKSIGMNIEFSDLENKIFHQLPNRQPSYLIQKFNNIKKLIYDTVDYDLDLKASYILVTAKFLS